MLLFNFELFANYLQLSQKTFKTFTIYQFPFVTGYKLFRSVKRHSSFVSLYAFLIFWWSSVQNVFDKFYKIHWKNLCQTLFLTKFQSFSLQFCWQESQSVYCYLKISKFLQCHRQPKAFWRHFERSVPSVNNHPTIFNIFQKFYENGPCT